MTLLQRISPLFVHGNIIQCQNDHVDDVSIFVKDCEMEAGICNKNKDDNVTRFEVVVCCNAIPSLQSL